MIPQVARQLADEDDAMQTIRSIASISLRIMPLFSWLSCSWDSYRQNTLAWIYLQSTEP